MRFPNWRKKPGTPEVPSYSPKCVEEEFSEVRGYKRAPIWAPMLPLAPHTSPPGLRAGW